MICMIYNLSDLSDLCNLVYLYDLDRDLSRCGMLTLFAIFLFFGASYSIEKTDQGNTSLKLPGVWFRSSEGGHALLQYTNPTLHNIS